MQFNCISLGLTAAAAAAILWDAHVVRVLWPAVQCGKN